MQNVAFIFCYICILAICILFFCILSCLYFGIFVFCHIVFCFVWLYFVMFVLWNICILTDYLLGQLRGRRPRYWASTLECMRHHFVRKWKYIMRFEKTILCFEIGLSPKGLTKSQIKVYTFQTSLHTFTFHGLASATIQCVQ